MPGFADFFAIFFMTLGPVKTIPVFFVQTKDLDSPSCWRLAFRASFLATIISLAVATFGQVIILRWRVSIPAIQVAGGIILLQGALTVMTQFGGNTSTGQPSTKAPQNSVPQKPLQALPALQDLALMPLAVPTVVTSYGVVAILVAMEMGRGDLRFQAEILALILTMMVLNFFGMGLAKPIIRLVGFANLMVVGWVVAVMQATLAAQILLRGLKAALFAS